MSLICYILYALDLFHILCTGYMLLWYFCNFAARPARNCSELQQWYPSLPDGDQCLAIGPDQILTTVYCHSMSDTPAEYITLVQDNRSVYPPQHAATRTTVYKKIRLNPEVGMITYDT